MLPLFMTTLKPLFRSGNELFRCFSRRPLRSAYIVMAGGCVFASLAAQPVPAENVLFRPTFLTPDISHYSGSAFRLKSQKSGQHYLVTAHSLFGPAADLDVQMTTEDISRVIMAAVGVSCTDPRVVVVARHYVPLPGARRSDADGAEKDLALFELPSRLNERALTLDSGPPLRGDRVWLYVKYPGTGRVGLEGATLAWVSEREVRYLFDNKEVDIRGATGAPILSKEGTVVGMHLGTFTPASGRKYGYACPASAIADVWEPKREKPASILKKQN